MAISCSHDALPPARQVNNTPEIQAHLDTTSALAQELWASAIAYNAAYHPQRSLNSLNLARKRFLNARAAYDDYIQRPKTRAPKIDNPKKR